MTHYVLKFGGSSLCDGESLFAAATCSLDYIHQAPTTIVVSATKGTTDLLLRSAELCRAGLNTASASAESTKAGLTGNQQAAQRVIRDLLQKHRQIARSLLAGSCLQRCLEQLENIGQQADAALLAYAQSASTHEQPHEAGHRYLAKLAACGEKLSAYLFAAQLEQAGAQAEVLLAENLITTDTNYLQAQPDDESCARQFSAQANKRQNGTVYIIPGFTGACRDTNGSSQTTLLGRNASDYSAALVARYWGTDLIIFGDTDGVYTSDPHVLADAEIVPNLTIADAQWLATCGAAVIHPRTFEPLANCSDDRHIKVRLRATGSSNGGSAFLRQGARPHNLTTRIALKNSTHLLAKDRIDLHPELNQFIADQDPHLLQAEPYEIITVLLADSVSAEQVQRQLQQWQSLFSQSLNSHLVNTNVNDANVAPALAHRYLAQRHALLLLVNERASVACLRFWLTSTSATTSGIQGTAHAHPATLAQRSNPRIALAIIGASGRIGSALVQRLYAAQTASASQNNAYQFDIVVLANSQHCLVNTQGFSRADHEHNLHRLNTKTPGAHTGCGTGNSTSIEQAIALLTQAPQPYRLLIDATASSAVANQYEQILKHGIGIVAANKISNAGSQERFDELQRVSRDYGAPYAYETTAGAALPLIQPLKNLAANADPLRQIQAVLSGTIGFVLAQLQNGLTFSQAIALAVQHGYAEPDPAIDLSGEDVARKLLVLLRSAGVCIEREQIEVQSLAELALAELALTPSSGVKNDWQAHDKWWQRRSEQARAAGKRLVYIAEFCADYSSTQNSSVTDSGTTTSAPFHAKIGLHEVDNQHPFYRLQTVENALLLQSELYADIPFCVRGPGAGVAITSSGLLSDIHVAAQGLLAQDASMNLSLKPRANLRAA